MPDPERALEVLESLSTLDTDSFKNNFALRMQMLQEARNLVERLETPLERMAREAW